jgi:hypothetical protein
LAAANKKNRSPFEEIAIVRASTLVMIGFAVLFGLLAVFVAQSWLTSAADARMKSLEAQKKPLATQTIVVAGKPLRYGNEPRTRSPPVPSTRSATCCRAASASCWRQSR